VYFAAMAESTLSGFSPFESSMCEFRCSIACDRLSHRYRVEIDFGDPEYEQQHER
jgi:hypothetical protein